MKNFVHSGCQIIYREFQPRMVNVQNQSKIRSLIPDHSAKSHH